jgi:predicted glycogen debranching enzyme
MSPRAVERNALGLFIGAFSTTIISTPGAALMQGLDLEWLEADGRGGFAMGTAAGVRTRRYHALVVAATTPPTGRVVLVNGLEVRLVTQSGAFALSSQEFEPGVFHPDGFSRIRSFRAQPWPRWVFAAEDGSLVEQEILALPETGETLVAYRLQRGAPGSRIEVRPLFSGRDYHSLHRENSAFRFEAARTAEGLRFAPYDGLPEVTIRTSGHWVTEPLWFRQFRYREEAARGLDAVEDLASPGTVDLDLGPERSFVAFGWARRGEAGPSGDLAELAERERTRRLQVRSFLELSADAYVAPRGNGHTIVAGYPWFTDWGRDTFIAMRGLCFSLGRFELAGRILREWSKHVRDGLLPNCFPDGALQADDNSVDAPLWFIVAAHEFRERLRERGDEPDPETERALDQATHAILAGLESGTRHGIRADADGLLACGVPGRQLTWMDAKVGDWVVTPRIGKPVEIQALWLNALRIGGSRARHFQDLYERALASFRARFVQENGALHDVVDADHVPGRVDASFRPNQILALGGLPFPLVDGKVGRHVVDRIEAELVTPLGLRTLACWEPGYRGHYGGGPVERDGAYHQGTAWPWLLGPFVEAWMRVRGGSVPAIAEARARFVQPLRAHLQRAGLGHVSEIADAEPPHTPRGCPFQAWSLGELLRLEFSVLAAGGAP